MDSQPSEGEQDGTQRWFAGLPSVGVVPPEALTDVHRRVAEGALERVRRQRALLGIATLSSIALMVALIRSPGLLCAVLPLAVLTLFYGPDVVARVWKLRALPRWVDERGIHGTVERFEGHQPSLSRKQFLGQLLPENQMSTGGTGPRLLRLDVLVEIGLVLRVEELPRLGRPGAQRRHREASTAPGGVQYLHVQTTSDRMAGTEQGATRPLATNERVELTDLARHDSVWRTILPGVPALPPILWIARAVFGWPGIWVVAVLTLLGTSVFAVTDLLAMRRRHAQVKAAQRTATVMGGVNRDGEQVEVLLPDKLLWTVGGRPAPDRLRERSRALSGTLGDRHAPTTF